MKRMFGTALFTLAAGVALCAAQPLIARAADSMGGAMMASDCKTADSAMMKMTMPDSMMMKASGHMDKDFAGAMMAHEKAMVAMAKMEVKCGKNAKAKAAAQKFLDESADFMSVLDPIFRSP